MVMAGISLWVRKKETGGQVDFYHNCFKIFGRSKNRGSSTESRSAPARAAYRAGEKIYDHRTGLWFDFTRRRGILHTEILLPDHAPRNFADRAILWNAVEYAEKQKNAQTARETELSLPKELPRQVQLDIARKYAQYFADQGMCADLCVHKKGTKNYHAHIMLTMRPLNDDGTWGQKTRKEYLLNSQGQRIKNSKGKWKSRNISLTGWDDEGNVEIWREYGCRLINRELEKRGLPLLDHRSYERQGLDKEAQVHLGPQAIALEEQGVKTKLGNINRAVRERNRQRMQQREPVPEAERPSYDEWLEQYLLEKEKLLSRGRERGR